MRMCKWNKFRGNNSTTISLQSADTRKRILCRLRGGPRDPNDDPPLYRDLGWLMDSAPFCCRALPQIYSILLPFWYINFYSIWFAAIAMVIERKGRGAHTTSLFLEISLPFFLLLAGCSSLSSSFPQSASIFFSFPRAAITRKGHFAGSLIPNAPLRLSRQPFCKTMLCYAH